METKRRISFILAAVMLLTLATSVSIGADDLGQGGSIELHMGEDEDIFVEITWSVYNASLSTEIECVWNPTTLCYEMNRVNSVSFPSAAGVQIQVINHSASYFIEVTIDDIAPVSLLDISPLLVSPTYTSVRAYKKDDDTIHTDYYGLEGWNTVTSGQPRTFFVEPSENEDKDEYGMALVNMTLNLEWPALVQNAFWDPNNYLPGGLLYNVDAIAFATVSMTIQAFPVEEAETILRI